MTQQEKNIKICERLGWSDFYVVKHLDGNGHHEVEAQMGFYKGVKWALPNHFACLNACHDMENNLTHSKRMIWVSYIDEVAGNPVKARSATAAQRAEAFGLTLGLWKEGE